ncbi:MAG: hypothetical protein HYT90_01490 [Candidatus Omnitrophica bacterium]|nr:hypothetical protein [Candidatus Omnitrophota bacterium]
MALLLVCLIVHAVMAQVIPWPWWVPDLTLLGLVVAVARSPGRWLLLSGIAGLWTVLWAVRFQAPLLAGYLAVGAAVQVLGRRWDAADAKVQAILLGGAAACLTFGSLWLHNLWSVPLVGLAVIHVGMTCAALPLVRRLALP